MFIYLFNKDILSVYLCQKFSKFKAYIPLLHASFSKLCLLLSAVRPNPFKRLVAAWEGVSLHEILYVKSLCLKEEGVQTWFIERHAKRNKMFSIPSWQNTTLCWGDGPTCYSYVWSTGESRCKDDWREYWLYTSFNRILILLEDGGSYGIDTILHFRAFCGCRALKGEG